MNGESVNEFYTQYLASMAFPNLFPDSKGDFTRKDLLYDVSKNESVAHLMKIAFLHKNSLVFPFVEHKSFVFWAYNLIERHRIISQVRFFFKKETSFSTLSKDELSEILENPRMFKQFLNTCMYSVSTIRGSFS